MAHLAEIGAGQEVARWFFRVGGAAGTIAKSISAHDMSVSDAIYGPSERCVSRKRLESMLGLRIQAADRAAEHESRGPLHVFCLRGHGGDLRFTRHDEGQGWLGIRFRSGTEERAVGDHHSTRGCWTRRMCANRRPWGVVGVNLIYAAFHYNKQPEALIESLMDGLTRNRIELDMIKFFRPGFRESGQSVDEFALVHGLTLRGDVHGGR